jgi:hypothetical protein
MSLFNNLISSSVDEDNIEQIGDNVFKFNLTLDNGKSKVKIKFSAIEELNIVDDLRYFYVYGTFTINYNNDVLEAFESVGSGMGGNNSSSVAYQFRGDGRDILEIDILPQLKEQQCLEVFASESEKEKFNIKHRCAIYKYEDLTSGKGSKSRKFYFWDIDYQYLSEINIDYSTGNKVNGTKKFYTYGTGESVEIAKSNNDNEEFTGNIINDLLETSLVEIANTTFKKGDWDDGVTKYFYSSPAQSSSLNDIEYILGVHSSDGANQFLPAILKKQRYTDKYELKPLNKYYKSSSLLGDFVEDFYIGKIDPSSEGVGSCGAGSEGALNLSDYNVIEDYTFTRVDAKELQSFMTSHVVYTYDPRGFFVADVKENNLDSAKDVYDSSFVIDGSRNLADNKIRDDYKNVKHQFFANSLDKNQRKNKGVNDAMLNMFFKNTSISFRTRGLTLRKTGLFFNVKRRDSNISNTYDNTVIGRYMITYVRHEFKAGSYTNMVHGVKPYDRVNPNLPTLT